MAIHFFRKVHAAAFGLVVLLAGCASPWQEGQRDQTSGLVTVRVGLTGDSGARVLVPVQPTATEYRLYGAAHLGTQTLLATEADYHDIVVNLAAGSWDFTLTASAGGVDVLEGTITSKTLGATPVTLAFPLSPLGTGTGSIDVTVNWPAATAITQIASSWAGGSLSSLTPVSGESYRYTQSGVAAAFALLSFHFYDASGHELATLSDGVQVLPNLTTTGTLTLAAGAINGAPAAPTGVAVQSQTDLTAATGTIRTSWTPGSTNQSGFEVFRSDNASSALAVVAAGATSYDDTTAVRGTPYTYSVRAVNAIGASAKTDSSSVTAPWLVSFDTDGADTATPTPVERADGGTVTEPTAPTKAGSVFGGWFTDQTFSTPWDFGTATVTGNLTLYALWN